MVFNKIAMIGIGAIGSVYGLNLYNCFGENFMVVAGGTRGEKLRNEGITVNETTFFPKVVDPSDINEKVDFIIFAVKNNGLQQAIKDAKNIIDENTAILPILNGVSARDEILDAYPNNHVFYGLSIAIDAVREGTKVISKDMGRIQFGDKLNEEGKYSDFVLAAQEVFDKSGVKYEICPDMERALWKKWIVNMGINQIFAITRSPYSGYFECDNINRLVVRAMSEVIDVAKAKGVNIDESDLEAAKELLKVFPKESKTSMHQDVEAGRKTEVEYFSGKLIEYGSMVGIATPVNEIVYDIIKGMEHIYLKK